jgi:hypothetical protein
MANSGVTMLGMAKKKPGRPPTGRKPTYTVYVRIDPAVGAALEEHIKSIQPRRPRRPLSSLPSGSTSNRSACGRPHPRPPPDRRPGRKRNLVSTRRNLRLRGWPLTAAPARAAAGGQPGGRASNESA